MNTECRVSGVVARGGNFLAGHKECSVATHHLSSSDGKKHMSEGCQNGVKKVPKS